MAGFGSAAAMIQSIKMNLAQKKARKNGKKGNISYKREKTEYNFGQVSNEELEKIMLKIV